MEKFKKLKIVTILGTRPEIIRLSCIIKKFDNYFDHVLIHTGQNYDYNLNEIFFEELGIRRPDYFLKSAGKNVGETIGNIISKSYSLFSEIQPDGVLILGDTNSSLSAIAAKRLKIPIFHMEAGNRCFDQNVPEELNRKICDHTADINLVYSENSRKYLLDEGFRKDNIFLTGSPMNEVLERYNSIIDERIDITLSALKLEKSEYLIASIHREENLDIGDNLQSILNALNNVAKYFDKELLFSTHPRTRKKIDHLNLQGFDKIRFLDALGFYDYIALQKNAFLVLSDSGTISEESAILNFPAVTVRKSIERPEAIDYGNIIVGGIDSNSIIQASIIAIQEHNELNPSITPFYQMSNTSSIVTKIVSGFIQNINHFTWRK